MKWFVHHELKALTFNLPSIPICNSNRVRAQNAAAQHFVTRIAAGAQLTEQLLPNFCVRSDNAPVTANGDSEREIFALVKYRRLP